MAKQDSWREEGQTCLLGRERSDSALARWCFFLSLLDSISEDLWVWFIYFISLLAHLPDIRRQLQYTFSFNIVMLPIFVHIFVLSSSSQAKFEAIQSHVVCILCSILFWLGSWRMGAYITYMYRCAGPYNKDERDVHTCRGNIRFMNIKPNASKVWSRLMNT